MWIHLTHTNSDFPTALWMDQVKKVLEIELTVCTFQVQTNISHFLQCAIKTSVIHFRCARLPQWCKISKKKKKKPTWAKEKQQYHQTSSKMWAEHSICVTWHVTLLYLYRHIHIYITTWEPTISQNIREGKRLLNLTRRGNRCVLYRGATTFLLFCLSNWKLFRLDAWSLAFGKKELRHVQKAHTGKSLPYID